MVGIGDDTVGIRYYAAIDLKSFYASVECIERGFNPLTTNLVVANEERSKNTICLAVSPSLKSLGVSGRPRLYEVIQKVNDLNKNREMRATNKNRIRSSFIIDEIKNSNNVMVDYIIAKPRMAYYIDYSTKVYNVYLKYISPDDIHVYSIDEVFMDITNYLKTYKLRPTELIEKIVLDVLKETGITATAGIGTNMYLAKIAMDIQAKKMKFEKNTTQIATLSEMKYKKLLWNHTPITDFWRIGKGYEKRLESIGLYTMGDIARCSLGKDTDYHNEELLYKTFGVNAELLIDHAWGIEPCTIKDIKSYKPITKSIGSGQVLHTCYTYSQAKTIVWEMGDNLSLDLVEKKVLTNQLVLTIGYDRECLTDLDISSRYNGEITKDPYGRDIPKSSHGTTNLDGYTSSTRLITEAIINLYEEIINRELLVRRINISANHIISENEYIPEKKVKQLDLFSNNKKNSISKIDIEKQNKERKIQETILDIKKKYGKNAVLKGKNLQEEATTLDRNNQIGGHNA